MLTCVHALKVSQAPRPNAPELAHKMMGPLTGTSSVPYTSFCLKKEQIAELARATKGLCDDPNGILGCYSAPILLKQIKANKLQRPTRSTRNFGKAGPKGVIM